MEKIKDFHYYMHIIWNALLEADNLGKEGNDILTYGERAAWGKQGCEPLA